MAQASGAAPMSEAKIVLSAQDQTKAAFASAIANLTNFHAAAEKVRGVLEAVGVTLSAGYFVELIKGTIEAGAHLDDLHKSTDISVEDLAGLSLIAKTTGTDLDGLAKGINRMSVEIGKAPDKFRSLGITARDGTGALKQFADIFNLLPDIQQRNALAQAVFQKSWAEMAPTLSKGSAGIEELMNKGRELSGMTTAQAAASTELNEKLQMLTGTHGLLNAQVASILPLLNSLADDMVDLQGKTAGLDDEFRPLAETLRAIVVVGGNVAFTFRGVGRELGALYAQVDALGVSFQDIAMGPAATAAAIARAAVTGEASISRFHEIHEQAQADADKDREAFDKWEQKIMGVGTALTVVGDTSDALSRKLQGQTRAEQAATAARAKAFLDSQNAAKDAATAYDTINKTVMERLNAQQAELAAGRELTDQEKFESKVLTDLTATKKTLTLAEKAAIETKLALSKAAATSIAVQKSELDQAKASALERQRLTQQGYDEAKKLQEQIDQTAHDQLVTGAQMLDQILFETSLLTMNTQAREVATAQRELERQGIKEGTQAWTDYGEAILAATGKKAELQQSIDNFKAIFDSVDKTAHDVFVDIFNGGKDAFTKLRDTLKSTLLDLLYQMTVKKWIFQIAASVTGTSSTVAGAAGNAIMGGGGSAVSSLEGSALSSVATSAIGGVVGAFEMGASGAVAGGVGVGIGAGLEAGLAAIPVVGWIGLAALALYSIFGGKGGGPKTEGGYAPGDLNIAGIDIGGNQQGSQRGDVTGAKSISQAISTGLTGLGNEFGITLAKDVGVFFAKDPQGDSLTQLNVVSDNYSRSKVEGGIENVGRSDAEFQAALAKATAQLDLTELAKALTGKIGDYLQALDPTSLTTDQIAADIQLAANAKQLTDVFTALGPAFSKVAAMSVEGLNNVADALGGIQAAGADLTSYYQNFYTDAEKKTAVATDISNKLAASGLDYSADQVLGATRDQFRQLEETLIGEGRTGAAEALMSVNAEFAALVPASNAAADAISKAQQSAKDQLDYENSVRVMYGNGLMQIKQQKAALEQQLLGLKDPAAAVAKSRQDELTAMNQSLWPLQQEIWAIQDATEARKAAEASMATFSDYFKGLIDPLESVNKGLQAFLDTLLGSGLNGLSGKASYAQAKAAVGTANSGNFEALSKEFLAVSAKQSNSGAQYQQDLGYVRSVGAQLEQSNSGQIAGYNSTLSNLQEQLLGVPPSTSGSSYSSIDSGSQTTQLLRTISSGISSLHQRLAAVEANTHSTATATAATEHVMRRVTRNGESFVTSTA
jgi:hypothetical protein